MNDEKIVIDNDNFIKTIRKINKLTSELDNLLNIIEEEDELQEDKITKTLGSTKFIFLQKGKRVSIVRNKKLTLSYEEIQEIIEFYEKEKSHINGIVWNGFKINNNELNYLIMVYKDLTEGIIYKKTSDELFYTISLKEKKVEVVRYNFCKEMSFKKIKELMNNIEKDKTKDDVEVFVNENINLKAKHIKQIAADIIKLQ